MTRRSTAFILTCITVLAAAVPLSACAPQPAEPAFLEKIRDTMIFTSQGDGQDNDLSIEAIVPDADSPEVAAYLDKLRTDKGQDAFEYNFDYVKEVMQMDSATIDDTLYDALIIAFTNMPDKDKETFLESAYTKANGGWDVCTVLANMTEKYKELLKGFNVSYAELSKEDSKAHELIFSYSLLKQVDVWGPINSAGDLKVDIARKSESGDATFSVGRRDNNGELQEVVKTISIYQFRETLSGIVSACSEIAGEKGNVERISILSSDRQFSLGLNLGAAVSIDEDGKYEIFVAAIDNFQLNMALRTYAIEHGGVGSDGLGYTAEDIAKALTEGTTDDLGLKDSRNNKSSLEQFVDWRVGAADAPEAGGKFAIEEYKNELESASRNDYTKTHSMQGLHDEEIDKMMRELMHQVADLKYEDMLHLEQEYPEYFDSQK